MSSITQEARGQGRGRQPAQNALELSVATVCEHHAHGPECAAVLEIRWPEPIA
jgi:hypothetical protein